MNNGNMFSISTTSSDVQPVDSKTPFLFHLQSCNSNSSRHVEKGSDGGFKHYQIQEELKRDI